MVISPTLKTLWTLKTPNYCIYLIVVTQCVGTLYEPSLHIGPRGSTTDNEVFDNTRDVGFQLIDG